MDQEVEERPVHTVVDMNGTFDQLQWTVTHTPITDEEWAEMKDRTKKLQEDQAAREKEDEELRIAVQNHNDPVVKALGARLGM